MPENESHELIVQVCECLLLEYERFNRGRRQKIIVTDEELVEDCERVFYYTRERQKGDPPGTLYTLDDPKSIVSGVGLVAHQRITINWWKQYGEKAHERKRERMREKAKWSRWKDQEGDERAEDSEESDSDS